MKMTGGGGGALPAAVSQAEAEAGVLAALRSWSPERIKQAIDALANGGLIRGIGGELTIAAGVIVPTHRFHTVDTEGDAADDDIDTIDGTNALAGDVLILQSADAARDSRAMNGAGNIITRSGSNLTLPTRGQRLEFHFDGTNWVADKYTG